jgi:hypothetical protein
MKIDNIRFATINRCFLVFCQRLHIWLSSSDNDGMVVSNTSSTYFFDVMTSFNRFESAKIDATCVFTSSTSLNERKWLGNLPAKFSVSEIQYAGKTTIFVS